jgi:C-terminal processing protease CtpA/Prc
MRTVGKDVAQAVVGLGDGSGLAFTVRAYCDPNGNDLSRGITPDVDCTWIDRIRIDKIKLNTIPKTVVDKTKNKYKLNEYIWTVEGLTAK